MHFVSSFESMDYHDSGSDEWRCICCKDAGFVGVQASDSKKSGSRLCLCKSMLWRLCCLH
ncbi:hypothetical protein D3W54_05300 [Komagataeibacter medellinensis]|uniref:Uncharacterized protein n=1 Tax=Komagataeibacter medellinensis TaxID=1177712 RepID=A0ABQ6VU36_9PROT|nr:hypothetical protein D3W54_05300 [Komagataeibacter medellinensis]